MSDTLSPDAAARLRELEDKAEIAEIVDKYGQGVRTHDVDLLTSLFSDDAILDHGHGTVVEGGAAIRHHFTNTTNSPVAKSVNTFDHKIGSTPIMTNTLVTVNGDTAHCESMCLAIHMGTRDGETIVMVRGTRNIDDLIRTPSGWKIQHRTHPAVWKFEVPGESYGDGN